MEQVEFGGVRIVRAVASMMQSDPAGTTSAIRRPPTEMVSPLMKSRTGNSPAHFASMIKTQSWRVSEVSDTLGFVNPFHFPRVFRRFHGLPPSRRPRPDVPLHSGGG